MKTILSLLMFISVSLIYAQIPATVDSAYMHIKEQFDRYHKNSYVYSDDNAGGNIYIPSIWQGGIEDIYINQAYTEDPVSGRSCTKIVFPLNSQICFSAIKYVYPENNIGNYEGFDISEATELSFYTKGSGIAEFILGGMNRRPFYSDTLQFQDGVDIRSSGLIELTDDWEYHTIDLTNNTFWVYKDSTEGLNNKYIQPVFMDDHEYFDFYYGADADQGDTCMKGYWFGGSSKYAGVFLFPPEGDWNSTQGYNLTGIKKIHFKAKISEVGNVKFLFGRSDDSCGHLTQTYTLSKDWQWYEWILPSYLDYSDVIGGFGFFFGGDINTPNFSTTYLDSIYYEGVELASDFSNLICGFTVSSSKNLNPDTMVVYIDEVKYNKDRTDKPRLCQSYICDNDSIDIGNKNTVYTYDNALKLIADLMLYNTTSVKQYLIDAKLTGDAFIYAINNDRYFNDGRLRNAYMSGELKHYDGTVRMPGWWDENTNTWYEDKGLVSTSTGNVAWAGLALASLYEVTLNDEYLNGAEILANWCIDKTATDYGFTGGFVGWGLSGQDSLTWKSTEHNIDLYALFTRLYWLTSDSNYYNASENAKNFVLSMWNQAKNHFWTGTDSTGININTDVIPLDIQMWYTMAFQDTVSQYILGIDWGKQNCYLVNYNSFNYSSPISGFDFDTDLDGIWFEGSSQAALANKMIGNEIFAEDVLYHVEYVQNHRIDPLLYNCNNKGIVASDHNHLSTGFDWEFHNRLHIGATCWYIFAKLGYNPYYYPPPDTNTVYKESLLNSRKFKLFQNYPNPFNSETTISFSIPNDSQVKIYIYNIKGEKIKILTNDNLKSGQHNLIWDGRDENNKPVSSGIYLYKMETDNYFEIKRAILLK
jgi:hypothetical protein